MKLNIINACSDLGVNVCGANLGPKEIKKVIQGNKDINKIIDIECDSSNKSNDPKDMKKNIVKLNEFNSRLYDSIISISDKNSLNITIGGDHSIVIASALASIEKNEKLGIIWIDTHPDFNTFETTVTGNIHGLPLATITDNNGYELTEFHDGNYYKNENTVILGARDIDLQELENLNKCNIKTFTTENIKNNLEKHTKEAIDLALNNTNGIHLSIDLDVLDPSVAPGISVGFNNGLSKEELFTMLDIIFEQKEKIKSIDLVEFNPLNDKNNKTLDIAIEVLEKIINTFK